MRVECLLLMLQCVSGSLDAKKAASFGAKGKQLGQLKNGEDVKLVRCAALPRMC